MLHVDAPFGRFWHFEPKMAKTSSGGPPLERTSFGSIGFGHFYRSKCHSLLYRSGNKLRLPEVLIFIFWNGKI
jgi:hypothetical protein